MKNITIIGLSGKKSAGKNTVATLLVKLTTEWAIEVAFGNFVKQEVALGCGVTVDHINKNKEQFRPILQWWGTEFRRASNSDYWIYKMDNLLFEIVKKNKAKVIVITDVRFQNEYDYLQSVGGLLIRVSRPVEAIDNHLSEIALDKNDKWDSIILNTGTVEELKPQVVELLNKCKLKIRL